MPVSSGWVRDGLFVIGMDSEFAVYSQWKPTDEDENADVNFTHQGVDTVENRNLQDTDLLSIAQVWYYYKKIINFTLKPCSTTGILCFSCEFFCRIQI